MHSLSWICVLLAAALWRHGGAQLTVVVEEARATGTSPQMVLIVEETRVFDLAPGLTYRIHCRSVVGFGGLSGVWQDGNGTAIETRDPAPALDFDEAAVYSTPRNPDSTNEWSLVLQSFSQSGTGTYVCPSAEEGGTDAVLQIGMSNPTIIPNIPSLTLDLRAGFFGERPSFLALASSNPQPESIEWLFLGQELVNGANGIIVSTTDNVGELLFPQMINSSIAGDYVFRMESGAGSKNITLTLVVKTPPTPPQHPEYDVLQYNLNDFTVSVEWESPASDGGVGIDSYTLTGAGITAPLTVLSNEPLTATLTLSYNEMHMVSITASNSAGQSTASMVTIHEVGCGPPTPPPRGSLGDVTSSQEGAVVAFQCNPGLAPSQQMMSVCAANGSWTPDPAELVCRADCGDPPSPMNGFVTESESTLEGSQIVFQCSQFAPGFAPSQQRTSVCMADGNWSPDPAGLVCKADCGTPVIISGSVNYTTTVEESIATYQCDVGLVPRVVVAAVCTGTGDWDPDPANAGCRLPSTCAVPTAPATGSVDFTDTVEGSIAAYQCDTGLVSGELFAAVCSESGEWVPNPSDLSCSQTEGEGLSTLATVGIAIGLTFIASFTAGLLVASFIAYCYVRRQKGHYSPKVFQKPVPTYENVPKDASNVSIAMSNSTEAMNNPTVAMNNPTVAMNNPTVAMNNPTVAMNNPTVAMSHPPIAMSRPPIAMSRPPVAMSNPAVDMSNSTVADPIAIESKHNEAYGSANHIYDTVNSAV